jgi:hypothetical protein
MVLLPPTPPPDWAPVSPAPLPPPLLSPLALESVNPLDVVFQSALEVPPPVWEDLLPRRAVSLASPRVVSPVLLLRALRLVEDLQVDLVSFTLRGYCLIWLGSILTLY